MKQVKPIPFEVREASLDEIYQVHQMIPEFTGKIDLAFYEERLRYLLHLALVAEFEGRLIGFKVGYQSDRPETFYSWMGGVVPEFRRSGVAMELADTQESWAVKKGFREIFFKTRNRFPRMIDFGLKRGFKIIEIVKKGGLEDYRIVMWKNL